MTNKATLLEQYRTIFPDWSEEELDYHATKMALKYSTVKEGPDVVHLTYFQYLLDNNDIKQIETTLQSQGLQLGRFDKSGVPYNSLEDFTLQVALFLSAPIVQNILIGVGTNALWDAIKVSSIYIWKRLKERVWHLPKEESKHKINFGLKLNLNDDSVLNLKLDGDIDEETILQALDKVIDLAKSTQETNPVRPDKFFVFDKKKKQWIEIDVMKEIMKIANAAIEKK